MDVVVTVPKPLWEIWLEEGDLPGDPWSGEEFHFNLGGWHIPNVFPGERVYIVAHGKLRGYAPLIRVDTGQFWDHTQTRGGYSLVRHGQAEAVTIPKPIQGFQGFRYRWWEREIEIPFPDWKNI